VNLRDANGKMLGEPRGRTVRTEAEFEFPLVGATEGSSASTTLTDTAGQKQQRSISGCWRRTRSAWK
jgi:hypothetical protein